MEKETRELYRGTAVIVNVTLEGVEDWKEWERRGLNDVDKTNAFKLVYDVAEGNEHGDRHEVKIEISHRELRGKMLDYYAHEDYSKPTQMDVAIKSLVQQGLIPKGATESDIIKAADDSLVGKKVTIRVYEELGKDGAKWWPRCVFASARCYIAGADKAARMAAFIAGKPAPKATVTDPNPKATMPSAPADDFDMPF